MQGQDHKGFGKNQPALEVTFLPTLGLTFEDSLQDSDNVDLTHLQSFLDALLDRTRDSQIETAVLIVGTK